MNIKRLKYKNNTLLYMRRFLKGCPSDMLLDYKTQKCKCKPGHEPTNKGTCVKKPIRPKCTLNKQYNESKKKCVCKLGFIERNNSCVKKPIRPKCTLNKQYNESKKKCVCKPGFIERNNSCIRKDIPEKCPAGSVRNNQGICVCIRGHTIVNGKCVKNTQRRSFFGTQKLKPPSPRKTMNPLRESSNSLASSASMSNGFNELMQLMKQSKSRSRRPTPPKTSKPVESIKKIKLTIIRTPKNAPESLDIVKRECPSSMDCLLLNNKHRDKIKELFDNFRSFTSLKSVLHLSKASGGNADVCLLTYNFHEYETKALMKTQKPGKTDSLVYEFLMGKQINRYLSFLPNFVETYSLFKKYKDADITLLSLRKKYTYYNKSEQEMLEDEINKTTQNSLLVEYVHNATKIDLNNKDFVDNDLIPVLFQIYYALYKLNGKFVHYDLYIPNIMLYEPYKGSHIKFNYQIEGETYEFYSRYIAKIIDYGRVFTSESTKIHKQLCIIQENKCGGVSFPVSNRLLKDYFNFDYVNPNQSSDLSLLYQLKDIMFDKLTGKFKIENDNLEKLFKFLPELKESPQTGKYDIPPKSSSGKMINNVTDAFERLKKLIKIQTKPSSKSAEIIIYGMDKPFELIEKDYISPNNSLRSSSESSIENLNNSSSISEMVSSSENSYNEKSSVSSLTNNSVFNYNQSSRESNLKSNLKGIKI